VDSLDVDASVKIRSASFHVSPGEVVGIAGLQGSGASELMKALFGASGRIASGSVQVFGQTRERFDPRSSIADRIAYVPNDRKAAGLVLSGSIVDNLSLVCLPHLSPNGMRRPGDERKAAREAAELLHLKAASLDDPVSSLSGGNQQKVALGKWLGVRPKILMLDEPTRGIDIGAKKEIYALIDQWRAEGMAILLITSELPELLLLSDRILVMHRGRIVREFDRQTATAQNVIQAAMSPEAA
jgi:ABC-type sugar transport system ATPase subunit